LGLVTTQILQSSTHFKLAMAITLVMYATYSFACFFVDRLGSSSSRLLTKEVERWIGFQGGIRTKGARCRCFASLSDDIIVDPRRSSGGSLLLFTASWRRKESCDAVERSIGPCDEHDETRSRQATAPIIMRSLAAARARYLAEPYAGSRNPPRGSMDRWIHR
jgi:hypothetical protein